MVYAFLDTFFVTPQLRNSHKLWLARLHRFIATREYTLGLKTVSYIVNLTWYNFYGILGINDIGQLVIVKFIFRQRSAVFRKCD